MYNKRIIFIAGTSYSGSTLLDLIFSNNSKATSVGEIESIFNPVKKHHLTKIEEVKKDSVWAPIYNSGVAELYQNLHELLGVELIVDSSKNPAWIRYHIDRMPHDVSYNVVLVYKTLPDFKHSFEKRNRNNWAKVYKNYHSLFFNIIDEFERIEFSSIPLQSKEFLTLFDKLGLTYSNERMKFWDQKRTNFFGNNNANIAFYSDSNNDARKLKYLSKTNNEVSSEIERILQDNRELKEIVSFLNGASGSKEAPKSSLLMDSYIFRYTIKKIRVALNHVRFLQ